MKIFLDDVRPTPAGYTCIRDVEVLKKVFIWNQDKVKEISLDHDLGENVPTGYDFLVWLEEGVAMGAFEQIPELKIHSANPVGRKNMEAAIKSIYKMLEERGE